jgi:hypothetical protein
VRKVWSPEYHPQLFIPSSALSASINGSLCCVLQTSNEPLISIITQGAFTDRF